MIHCILYKRKRQFSIIYDSQRIKNVGINIIMKNALFFIMYGIYFDFLKNVY